MATRSLPLRTPGLPGPFRRVSPAILIFAGTLLGFLAIAGILFFYLLTHRSVTDLPGIQEVAKPIPPRLLFSFAGVANPTGIAVSPDGQRIYVAEGGGQRFIKVFDREGKPQAQLMPPGSEPGTRLPAMLSVDKEGRLWVAERMKAEVQTYAPSLQWEGAFRPPVLDELGGWLPNGVSVSPNGRVLVAEIGSAEHQVLVMSRDGTVVNRFSKSSGVPGGLNYPVQAVEDEDGRVYVSDGNAGRVLAISPRGVKVITAAGADRIGLPRGMAVSAGKLFVADSLGNRVAVFAVGDQPQYLYSIGADGGADGLAYPSAVAVDSSGRVYVADRADDRVQVWTY